MSLVLLRYRGREIRAEDTAFIQRLIAENPRWSRRRLSAELCRAWNWVQPNGTLRDMVCRSLLLQLHRTGLIELPAKRMSPPNNVVERPAPAPTLPLWEGPRQCALSQLGPLEIRQVRRTAEEPLFGQLMHAHHYRVPSVDVRKVKIPGNSAKSAGRAAIPEDRQAGGGLEDQPVSAGASASV